MILSLPRSLAYACAGALLSAGAPAGLLAVRCLARGRTQECASPRDAIRELSADPPGYIYSGAATAIVFTLFGWLLGRQADRLIELSETDALTGLCNARGLFGRLHVELARSRRYGQPLSLLLVDLDGLKRINDAFGHDAGDEALRVLSRAIRSELRETDVGARWGGDEFVVLAPNTSQTAALALADRIRSLLALQRGRWRVTASIGVASVESPIAAEDLDAGELLRMADGAMYEAKLRGRNRVSAESAVHARAGELQQGADHLNPV